MSSAFGSDRGLFEGTFVGVGETPGRCAVLVQDGARVTGILAEGGMAFAVSMTVSGLSGEGTVGHMLSGQKQPTTIELEGETLVFESSGGRMELQRGELDQVPKATEASGPSDATLDQALVGHWSRTESMYGDGLSIASQKHMVFQADGTYLEPSGEAVGSGHGWTWQGDQRGMRSAKWTTKESHIYFSVGGPYQLWARYYIEGNTMLITYQDGSRETWYR